MTFWYWNPAQRRWIEVNEYSFQDVTLPTKREQYRKGGFCTAVVR